jgi:glycosyltransferase involved in cell wall biosynthesis
MDGHRVDRVFVVIAAFNEARVLAHVIADVRRHEFPVVVVDDGSQDTTAEVAEQAGAVESRTRRGTADRPRIRPRRGAEFIVTFDADGQHRAADIARLIGALVENGADFALGSRFLGEAIKLPASRKLLLKAATWFTRLTSGSTSPTPTTACAR